MKLLSFHGSQEIKNKYVARLKEHRRLEHLIQGVGFESNGTTKGCAVGCTLNDYNHKAYETELGLPEWLAKLEDHLFEHLPKEKAEQFAVDFLEAIPVGKNIEPIRYRLAILRQEANLEHLKNNKESYADKCRNAIQLVIDWHQSLLGNRSAAESAVESARSARSAAWSARSAAESARSAAWSAAESARSAAWSARSAAWSAWPAAWSAAESARSAAWSAAWSVARSAAESAAESAAWSAWSAAWSARSAAESAAWSAESTAESAAWYEWEVKMLLQLLSEA